MGNSDNIFRHDKTTQAISDVCSYFDAEELTLAERWYVCLCIEQSAERIMSNGFEEIAEQLENFKANLWSEHEA